MTEGIKKHALKITVGTVVAAVLFIIYTTITLSDMKNDIYKKLENCETGQFYIQKELEKMDIRIDDNETTNNEVKVKLASIEAQLTGISLTLEEIKRTLN